jgi:hypothetical protein
MNLPDSNVLPAPLWLITGLHILTLTLHFAAMNFLVGGIVALFASRLANRPENPTLRRFVALFPTAMAVTVTLGVAPLLFLQLVYPAQMYSASIVSGWFWIMVIPAAMLAYSLVYAASFASKRAAAAKTGLLWPALAALVYISLVYSSVFSMAERPDVMRALYRSNQTGLVWNPHLGDYVLRWLHMLTGAVTVGGFFVGLLARGDEAAFAAGKRVFTWGMAAAAVAGFFYLGALQDIVTPLMRSAAIWALTVAVVLSLGALHFFYQRAFVPSGLALFVSLLLMVYLRHEVRLLRLADSFDPASVRVVPQWSAFAVFLVSFLAALGLLAYMLRLFFGRAGAGRSKAKSA